MIRLGASNSCINPILYTFFNRKYKRGLIDLLRLGFCCRPAARLDQRHSHEFAAANKSLGGALTNGRAGPQKQDAARSARLQSQSMQAGRQLGRPAGHRASSSRLAGASGRGGSVSGCGGGSGGGSGERPLAECSRRSRRHRSITNLEADSNCAAINQNRTNSGRSQSKLKFATSRPKSPEVENSIGACHGEQAGEMRRARSLTSGDRARCLRALHRRPQEEEEEEAGARRGLQWRASERRAARLELRFGALSSRGGDGEEGEEGEPCARAKGLVLSRATKGARSIKSNSTNTTRDTESTDLTALSFTTGTNANSDHKGSLESLANEQVTRQPAGQRRADCLQQRGSAIDSTAGHSAGQELHNWRSSAGQSLSACDQWICSSSSSFRNEELELDEAQPENDSLMDDDDDDDDERDNDNLLFGSSNCSQADDNESDGSAKPASGGESVGQSLVASGSRLVNVVIHRLNSPSASRAEAVTEAEAEAEAGAGAGAGQAAPEVQPASGNKIGLVGVKYNVYYVNDAQHLIAPPNVEFIDVASADESLSGRIKLGPGRREQEIGRLEPSGRQSQQMSTIVHPNPLGH